MSWTARGWSGRRRRSARVPPQWRSLPHHMSLTRSVRCPSCDAGDPATVAELCRPLHERPGVAQSLEMSLSRCVRCPSCDARDHTTMAIRNRRASSRSQGEGEKVERRREWRHDAQDARMAGTYDAQKAGEHGARGARTRLARTGRVSRRSRNGLRSLAFRVRSSCSAAFRSRMIWVCRS
jgi:hypothetical protein